MTTIEIDETELLTFVNECSFIGENAERVRDAMIAGLNRTTVPLTLDSAEATMVATIRKIQRSVMADGRSIQVHLPLGARITLIAGQDSREIDPRSCRDGIDRG